MDQSEIEEAVRLAREFVPGKEFEEGPKPAPAEMANTLATSTGTGFFVSADGWLVTNAHVVSDSNKLRVVTRDRIYNATLIKLDKDRDLALLKVDGQFSVLPVTSTQHVRMGAAVMTIGFPMTQLMGFTPKMARGEVAALSGILDHESFFQISAPVQPGNSGGALVDERGNVIGIVCSKLSKAAALKVANAIPENVNYAIKSDVLLAMIRSMSDTVINLSDSHTAKLTLEDLAKLTETASAMILAY
jgi:S1-C subfamily serine protease